MKQNYFEDVTEILDDEYQMLSERFEFITAEDTKEIPKFIVTSKKQNIKKLMRFVFDNELNELEKKIAVMHFIKNIPITKIAVDCDISRRRATTILKNAENKLYTFLKYPYMMGFSLLSPPKDFKEILSE